MIKIRSINFRPADEAGGKWVAKTDCSRRDRAREEANQRYEQAEAKKKAAEELQKNVEAEQKSVDGALNEYDKVYSNLEAAGTSYLTQSNIDAMNIGSSCLTEYKQELGTAMEAVNKEVTECNQEFEEATKQKQLADGMSCDVTWEWVPY